MAGIIERLTEGVVNRDMRSEGHALLQKWERTGLLEGMDQERTRHTMARLLENQAKELLRESSTMAGGDVEGFAAVAFPIVRRVFAGLIANNLVSVQPMSLPSGLIFFLDFTVSEQGAGLPRLGYGGPTSQSVNDSGRSLYGGNVVGSEITGGVDISGNEAELGPYMLNNGYSSPTASATIALTALTGGVFGENAELDRLVRFDPDLTSGSSEVAVATWTVSGLTRFEKDDFPAVTISSSAGYKRSYFTGSGTPTGVQLARLTRYSGSSNATGLIVVADYAGTVSSSALLSTLTGTSVVLSYPLADHFSGSNALGSVIGQTSWGLENNPNIPEIDIKVDSVAVTANTKKLKAKWTPELGQDLNAYHNLDAEVELTSILSEQIALEIDQEILADLINGAKAATLYWSRSPGLFVNRVTGMEVGASAKAPDFTGTVSEWYETLAETINDVSAAVHRKTLRGGANFVVCGPEVANVLEFTAGFRASVTHDEEQGSIGSVKVGSLSKKFDVYVDPYFPRNVVLVGRRGSSFLESGYVYAPYVPLQTTPTIFGPEDFVPRKGVMTRYAKKMVRPDMYGLVIVQGLEGQSGG